MLLFSVAFSLLFAALISSPVSANQSDAATAISSAQNTILPCYDAAKAAEAAGANITSLTNTLNEAGSLLSQAQLAYSQGDFDAATNYAAQSQNKLNGFVSQADNLKQAAAQRESRDYLVNFVGSIVGAVAVVVAGFVIWFFLKRRYGAGDADAGAAAAV
jgi:cobalamin biosynthesis Mg chelatase CobN